MSKENRNIVYSTNPDWKKESNSINTSAVSLEGQIAHIQRQTKGRGGKTVTIVSNLKGNLKQLQKELQKYCGTGGTLKNNQIEIQGDQRNKITDYLNQKGCKTKNTGG